MVFRETVFALSSGGLPSGVAVIRLSGPHVRQILPILIGGDLPAPRRLALKTLRDERGFPLDDALAVFFEGPSSFTGEDCAELHVHGSKAVVSAVLRHLASFEGLRQAEAGEFTRRAFLNGKLDLTEAEALADLINAETEAQRRLALNQASGAQRELYDSWRERLLFARAMIEAELDFSDEGDVPGSVSDRVWADVDSLVADIYRHEAGYHAGEIIREGFRVALIGAPNVGKSSLLNALTKRDVALVTDIPGTTRDAIEVQLDLHGLKVVLTDTAGLRETTDIVEALGIERTRKAAAESDLVLLLEDLSSPGTQVAPDTDVPTLRIGTKLDVAEARPHYDFCISTRTGAGIDGLIEELSRHAQDSAAVSSVIPIRIRQVELLQASRAHLGRALDHALPLELRAEELRLAADRLGRITGHNDVEDLLGVIFSQFCVGK